MQKKKEMIESEQIEKAEAPKKRTAAKKSGNVSLPQSTENEFLIKKDAPTAAEEKPKQESVSPKKATSKSDKETAKKKTSTASKSTKSASAQKKSTKASTPRVVEHVEDEVLHSDLRIANEALLQAEAVPELMLEEPQESPGEELQEVPVEEPEVIVEEPETPKKHSAFRLRRASKKQEPDADLSVLELIHRRSGLSEEDVDMMFELGYENELGRLVGYETMKKLRYEHLRRSSHSEHKHYRTAFGYRGEEYVSTKQNESVRAAYAHDKKLLLHRVLLTALISFVLFFLDFPNVVGGSVAELHDRFPLIFPILSIIGLALAAFLSARQLYAGARSLLRFTPTPYSIALVTVPLAGICALIGLIPSVDLTVPVCHLASLCLFALAIGDIFRLSGELRAFRIVSVEAEKTVLEVTEPIKKKLMQGNKIVKVVSDGNGDNLYRVRKADQTTGFFRRFNAMDYAAIPLCILLGASTALSFLAAFVWALLGKDFGFVLTAFVTTLLLSTPVSLIFSFFYPLGRANAVLAHRNCALVGDEASEEYSEPQTVIFNDTDLYTAEKHAQISVREGDEFRHDLRVSEVVFRKLGGTLGKLGFTPTRNYDSDPSVSFVHISSNGVEAIVDGKSHVLFGSADFLRRNGIHVPTESTDAELRRTKSISVMYIAVDNILRLSYDIKYKPDTDFEDTLGMLCSDGTAVAIQSYDPNLTDDFLLESRLEADDPVSVIHPGRFDADTVQEVVDTGAVALGQRRDIALPLHAAKCVSAVRRRGFFFQIAATVIGAVGSVLLAIFDPTAAFTPLAIALYQLAWSGIALIGARFSLNANRLNV